MSINPDIQWHKINTLAGKLHGGAIGMSVKSRPLWGVGSPDTKVLFLGTFHGDESIAAMMLWYWLSEKGNTQAMCVPVVNPDGLLEKQRGNANGVDLNRNWPTQNWEPTASRPSFNPGPKAASEPETRAIQALIEKMAPRLIVTLHAPYKIINYDGPAEAVAAAMSKASGWLVKKDIGYPTPGSFGTWAGVERNIPTVTLELPDYPKGADADGLEAFEKSTWRRTCAALEAAVAWAQ